MQKFGSLLVMDAVAGLGEPDLATPEDAWEESVDQPLVVPVDTPVRGYRVAPKHRASRRWQVMPLSER